MKNRLIIMSLLASLLFCGCQKNIENVESVQNVSTSFQYNILEADGFKASLNRLTSPERQLQINKDLSNAYIGGPFQVAWMDQNGTLSEDNTVYFPLIHNRRAEAFILLKGDGCYREMNAFELLNNLLVTGKAIALVYNNGSFYAISEDNEVTLLMETPGEASITPALTFAEAAQFNNVVSLESLTKEFNGENSEEILSWIYGE